jgi:hypothetical protein
LEKFVLKTVISKGAVRQRKGVNRARAFILSKVGVSALGPPTPAQAEKPGLDASELAERPEGGPAPAFESDARPRRTPNLFEGY